MDPSLFRCKWDRYEGATIELWHQYILLVKRGQSPLNTCPPHFYDIADAELLADAQLAKRKREADAVKDFLKAQGIRT